MILNINNNAQIPTPASNNININAKKQVELHLIYSTEVLDNTKMVFERMANMKIIDTKELEKTVNAIDIMKNEKKAAIAATTITTQQ